MKIELRIIYDSSRPSGDLWRIQDERGQYRSAACIDELPDAVRGFLRDMAAEVKILSGG